MRSMLALPLMSVVCKCFYNGLIRVCLSVCAEREEGLTESTRRGEEQEEEGEVVIRHPRRNGVAENRS